MLEKDFAFLFTTNKYSTAANWSEFKDDLVELMIDETVSILAGDIESMNSFQRMSQSVEKNN